MKLVFGDPKSIAMKGGSTLTKPRQLNGSSWRNTARPIIAKVLAETQGDKEIRKALHDAYPFGMRKYHPYKIWLDEIRRQRKK